MKLFDYILKAFIKDKDQDQAGTVAEPVQPPIEVPRCPMCGVRATWHVCDMAKDGKVVAQAFICEEHGMYYVGDKTYDRPELFEQVVLDAIHDGLATELY